MEFVMTTFKKREADLGRDAQLCYRKLPINRNIPTPKIKLYLLPPLCLTSVSKSIAIVSPPSPSA
jgi:hypothetical protein